MLEPAFLIEDTSSNGGFPIAMLVYRSVNLQFVKSMWESFASCQMWPRIHTFLHAFKIPKADTHSSLASQEEPPKKGIGRVGTVYKR